MRSAQSIVPVILAAGDSTRMGYPKALLPLGGELFLTRILRVLRELGMGVPRLVLGRAADRVMEALGGRTGAAALDGVEVLVNPDPDRGQLSSIQLGFGGLEERCDAAMIWPVDQPAVSGELVRRLVAEFLARDCRSCRIAVPFCGGRRGHPAIFHRTLFHEFMEAPLDKGARGIIPRYESEALYLPTDDSASVTDIDTPDEYRALTGQSLAAALPMASRQA
ncbi:MAG: nucleotidyltransferase family protein [Acidobacteriota bacterium]|jgi:CTP:molybdopterin cytidylyltransferase MocA|nr:nucleotidyltransferase family protein [Acidobacteriota bacterium]